MKHQLAKQKFDRTKSNMAALVGRDVLRRSGHSVFVETASIALPSGLTYAEVVEWMKPFIPSDGRLGGIVSYR